MLPRAGTSGTSNRPNENVGDGNEACTLEGFARGKVVRAATRARDSSESIALAFEFLNQVRTEAAPAKRFIYLHINIPIGQIIMEENAAFAGSGSIEFQNPLPAALTAVDAIANFLFGRQCPNHCAVDR